MEIQVVSYLAIINNATTNILVYVSFQISVLIFSE